MVSLIISLIEKKISVEARTRDYSNTGIARIQKSKLCSMLQNKFGTYNSEKTHYSTKKHADLKACQTSYRYVTDLKKKVFLYLNPSCLD